jgi:hypothetical protein
LLRTRAALVHDGRYAPVRVTTPARAVAIAPSTVELSTPTERRVGVDDRFRCRTFIERAIALATKRTSAIPGC